MKFRNVNPISLKTIENAFRVLLEDPQSKTGVSLIEEALTECFKDTFTVRVVPYNPSEPVFVMSVFPEVDTLSKIIDIVTHGTEKSYSAIQKLWEKNTKWTIEIDEYTLRHLGPITERELTALLLHEIGHTICSNAISTRIVTILQYEYAQTKMRNKLLLRDKIFRSIMALPILNACVSDQKGSSIKEEIKADGFVKRMGYVQDLISVLRKIERSGKLPKGTPEDAMATTARFSMQTLDNIRERKSNLVKKNLVSLEESVRSPFIQTYLTELYGTWFVDRDELSGKTYLEQTIAESKKENLLQGIMDRRETSYYREFGIFGKKKLEKIEPYEISYIEVKAGSMRDDTDKMLLVSYIHNKLDRAQFYLDILDDPEASKKYNVPHSRQYLETVRDKLIKLRDQVLRYRVPTRTNDIIIQYPSGYEG